MTETLTRRILTASILSPIFVLSAYFLPEILFQFILISITAAAGFEWIKLSQFNKKYQVIIFWTALLLSALLTIYAVLVVHPVYILFVIVIAIIFWIINTVFIIAYPRLQIAWYGFWWLKVINGVLLLVPLLVGLLLIHQVDKNLFILLFALVWSADIGAYVFGKWFGRTKFITKVSPNKTIEGVFGGIIASSLTMMAYNFILTIQVAIPDNVAVIGINHLITEKNITLFSINEFMMIVVFVIVSVIGDLYESLYKRASNLKDSGNILPGHGGILDRIDSLTSVWLVFILWMIGIFGVGING